MKNFFISRTHLLISLSLLCTIALLITIWNQISNEDETVEKISLVGEMQVLSGDPTNLQLVSEEPELVVSSIVLVDAIEINDVINDGVMITKEPITEPITVIESQPKKNELLSVSEINIFLVDSVDKANGVLVPLINKLKEDSLLRQEWLDWLSIAEDEQVKFGTEILLSTLPREELVGFATKSLMNGNKNVMEFTLSALSRRNDLDVVGSGLKDSIVNLLSDERVDRYAKMNAIKVLSERPELYIDNERTSITQVVEKQLLSEDIGFRTEAVNALIKLDAKNNKIETAVLSGFNNRDIKTRKTSLDRMDYQLELGLELTPEAISSIHYQVLDDISGEAKFAEGEKERYMETAAYILGNLDLTQSQIYEMQEAGLPYIDYSKDEESSDNGSDSNSEEKI